MVSRQYAVLGLQNACEGCLSFLKLAAALLGMSHFRTGFV